jgi:signal transduction histidine kinase
VNWELLEEDQFRPMREYVVLILIAIATAFGTGYYALMIQGSYTSTPEDVEVINELKRRFQNEVTPVAIVNFSSLFNSSDHMQLLDPVYLMPSPGSDREVRYSSEEDCFRNLTNIMTRSDFEKVWVWEEFRCGRRRRLPQNFFRQPPFIHPSGKSYSLLAFETDRSPFRSRSWVIQHLPYFHVLEYRGLKEEYADLGGVFNYLVTLDRLALRDVVSGQNTILTERYLLARLNYPAVFSVLEYRFYAREDLERFLEDSPYHLQNYKPGKLCFYRDGPLCWDYNVHHVFRLANKSTLAIFFALVVVVFMMVRVILLKIRQQRLEDSRKRLALQVLTHEFRTPVTSLLLETETLSKRFSQMDEELQDAFLRMSSEIYRLQRLTEASSNYLRAAQDKKLIQLNQERVNSVNEFIGEFIAPYEEQWGDQLEVRYLEVDRPIMCDPYWLIIILKNLVENAMAHGRPPVVFTLRDSGDEIHFEILDHGECQFDDLRELTAEFVKGNQSSGSGLGLNIVAKVIKELGGSLDFQTRPTRFTIRLKNKKR